MIEYIKLFWEGAPEGEPAVILYEVDTENERLAPTHPPHLGAPRTPPHPSHPQPWQRRLAQPRWGGAVRPRLGGGAPPPVVIGKQNLGPFGRAVPMMEKQVAGNGKHTKTNEFFKDTQLHEMNGGATEDGMDRANQAKTPLQGAF